METTLCFSFKSKPRQHLGGVALIITLGFIVLLTGVIVAFFSRSILVRQISNSTAVQAKADLLALGALDTIVADLKQEILVSSSAVPLTPATSGTVYLPKTPADMLPSKPDKTLATNILKISSSKQPFYPGGKSVAIDLPTTAPSVNSRSVSLARWNKPLLVASQKWDCAPDDPASFTAPDWVLMTREGRHPTTLAASNSNANDVQNFVVGRYAYTIYHEGGLLDANVAGYPSSSGTYASYKNALAYADLTQLPTKNGTLAQKYVDKLVAYRNAASARVTLTGGSTFRDANATLSGSSYHNYVASAGNGSGFLTVGASGLSPNGLSSDRPFTSRSSLIQFMLQGLIDPSQATDAEKADMQYALQYLGTFSRDINQPSLIKTQSVQGNLPGHDSTAPQIQTISNGGNNQVTFDAYVNPAFPTVVVTNTFTRNDGSVAVKGAPLVKQRFALNRLAWLTYQGPSAARNQGDPDMQKLINGGISPGFLKQGDVGNIQKYFGLTWVPDSGSRLGKWVYDRHNGTSGAGPKGPILRLGAPGDTGAVIATLATPHEPDFFELLKASVSAGSKAKVSGTNGGSKDPSDVQAQRDISFDYAIMQLGANIIAQYQVDGFGIRIRFDDGLLPVKEFYGVVNNPYLYRVRWGVLKIRNEDPVITTSPVPNAPAGSVPAGANYGASQGLLKDPGVSMLMLIPEIWNPHDQNAPMPDVNLRPSTFRIVADSADPDTVIKGDAPTYQVAASGIDNGSSGPPNNPDSAASAEPFGSAGVPPFSRAKGGIGTEIYKSYKGYLHPLVPATTAMTFSVSGTTMFREPTLLARYNVPAGSNLKIDSSAWNPTTYPETGDYANVETSTGVSFTTNQGFTSDAANPLTLPTASLVTAATKYVGIPVGLFPNEWVGPRVSNQSPNTMRNIDRSDSCKLAAGSTGNVTFRLQYQDPTNAGNWITYDMKYVRPSTAWMTNVLGSSARGGMMQWGPVWAGFTDPRTSRFGGITTNGPGSSNTLAGIAAPGAAAWPGSSQTGRAQSTPANASEWIDPANGVLIPGRPTSDAGSYFAKPLSLATSNRATAPALGWNNDVMFLGMLSQNSMTLVGNGKRYSGAFGNDSPANTVNPPPGPGYYADPDNVVRRAMGGYNTGTTTVGLPVSSTQNPGPAPGPTNQAESRPRILHRPFRSVAELGYVFSDTPWKNLDFFNPESGDGGLLDVFCISDTSDPNGLVAGKVNLNTQQLPVLRAVLAGAYRDDAAPNTAILDSNAGGVADKIAQALYQRTSGPGGKLLTNISELIGKWKGSSGGGAMDGSAKYDGLSNDLSAIFTTGYGANSSTTNIQRFREAPIRALSATGTTRVWNLMIDVIAQNGRYSTGATALSKFVVDGEQRYWLHVAIDRFTGQVLDKQLEVVKE